MILGSGLIGDWLVRPSSLMGELVAGIAVLVAAARFVEGRTVAEHLGAACAYRMRSRWLEVEVDTTSSPLRISARGATAVRSYELVHRGRFDLSGRDVTNADRLSELAIGLSMGGRPSHVSLHVGPVAGRASTVLVTDDVSTSVEGWRENPGVLGEVAGLGSRDRAAQFVERWTYLRSRNGVIRVLRVSNFNAASSDRALLERVQLSSMHVSLALHLNVVESGRAQRVAARAVHRLGSDGAASRAAGFRRTARSSLAFQRVEERESRVASGQALVQIGVFICVRAGSLDELRASVREVSAAAERSGLRLERGGGNQAPWFCFQLPGGLGW